jgi:hypothetical protein
MKMLLQLRLQIPFDHRLRDAVRDSGHGDFILHLTQQGFKHWVAFAFCANDLRDRAAAAF